MTKFLVLVAVIFWGWSFVATKIVLQFLTPLEVTGVRLFLGLPILFLLIFVKKINLKIKNQDWMIVALCGLILAGHFVVQVTGLVTASATNTGWIIAVTPAVLATLSVLFLREKLSWLQISGVVTATIGVLLLISKGDFSNLSWVSSKGDWLILVSVFSWTFYTLLSRNMSRKYHPLAISTLIISVTTVLIFAALLIETNWSDFSKLSTEAWISLLFLGIFCQALAFWFWQEGVAKLGAAKTGFFLYFEPLATTALAVPYLNEQFGLFAALGATLLLGGVYLTQKNKQEP